MAPLSVVWHWQFPRGKVVEGVAHPALTIYGQRDLGCQLSVDHVSPGVAHVISTRNASSSFLCRQLSNVDLLHDDILERFFADFRKVTLFLSRS